MKLFMGLTTWKHAPHGKILKSDVTVAKNYLSEAHVKELNRIVSAYLDLAENRAQRGILMRMGKVSALEAKLKAEGEYEVYRKRQDAEFVSDFDRVVEEAKRIEGGVGPPVTGAGSERTRSAATSDKGPHKRRRKP